MKKRLFTLLLMVTWLCSMSAMTVSAEDATPAELTYRLSTLELAEGETIAAGQEFAIEVSLSAHEALGMVQFHFRYDKTLMQPVSSTTEGFLARAVMSNAEIAPARHDAPSDTYGEVWVSGFTDSDIAVAEGEVISSINFKALKEISADSPMVGYYALAGDSLVTKEYTCDMVNGGIVIGDADAADIPAEMTAPINNTVPPTTPDGNVAGADNNDESSSSFTTILLVVIGAVAVVIVVLLVVMNKKR